jgi:hypothetical protein
MMMMVIVIVIVIVMMSGVLKMSTVVQYICTVGR